MKILVLLAAAVMPLPPDIGQIQRIGCTADMVSGNGGTMPGWYVRVWAEYPDHKWSKLYAIESTRRPALRDCDRWMEAVRKAGHNGRH